MHAEHSGKRITGKHFEREMTLSKTHFRFDEDVPQHFPVAHWLEAVHAEHSGRSAGGKHLAFEAVLLSKTHFKFDADVPQHFPVEH